MSLDASLRAQAVLDTAALESLRPAWAALWARLPGASPFQSPDWLIPWWRHVGEGTLLTIAVLSRTELVGVVPLYVYTSPNDHRRMLFPLGVATTDRLDAIAQPGLEASVMAAAFAELSRLRAFWDVAEWPQLALEATLLQPAPEGWSERVEPAEPCAVLPLTAAPEAAGSPVSKTLLRDLRNWRGRAARAGDCRIERASPDTVDDLFAALLRLHAARWQTRGEAGVLVDPAVQAAHLAALPGLLQSDVLRLYALRLDAAVVGVLYGLIDRPGGPARRFHAYLGGFDPACARFSPGSLLIAHAISAAFEEEAVLFDFLRGREPYKYLWGARDEPTWCRTLRPPPP